MPTPTNLQYKIIYSKRRTVSLQIARAGNVVVRAPLRYPQERIQQLVSEKQSWIEKHLNKAQRSAPKQFTEGEMFLYLGKEYPLRILESYQSRLVFKDGFFLSKHKLHNAKKLFEDFYRKQAKDILLERSGHFARLMGVTFKKLNITGADTRWGSCSSSGSINFSWRLLLAQLEIVDYVVIHELAHITNKNHSQKFWAEVDKYFPNSKIARKWLKDFGSSLAL